MESLHGTTVLAVRREGRVVIGGDGQVTLGQHRDEGQRPKGAAACTRTKLLQAFAGGTADAFTLFERFEGKLEKHGGNLTRAAVELAKDWRTDRLLRRLEALLIVADLQTLTLMISGTGDVVEPERNLAAIGSGRRLCPGRRPGAMLEHTELDARTIVEQALKIAAGICIYTNENLTFEELAGA
jgi:ATP-dependent HslUV protease subunit HslV